MRHPRLLCVCALAGLAFSASRGTPPEILAVAETGYREDALPGRLVAWVHCRLERDGGDVRLRVDLRALGPGVDPVPGLEGVAGVNLRSAEELHRLLRDGGLAIETRPEDGSTPRRGRIADVRRGSLPTRRIAADGTLHLDAVTPAQLPVQATLLSWPLTAGRHHTYVIADGLPRLCVSAVLQGDHAAIEGIESLGELERPAPGGPQ